MICGVVGRKMCSRCTPTKRACLPSLKDVKSQLKRPLSNGTIDEKFLNSKFQLLIFWGAVNFYTGRGVVVYSIFNRKLNLRFEWNMELQRIRVQYAQ